MIKVISTDSKIESKKNTLIFSVINETNCSSDDNEIIAFKPFLLTKDLLNLIQLNSKQRDECVRLCADLYRKHLKDLDERFEFLRSMEKFGFEIVFMYNPDNRIFADVLIESLRERGFSCA